MILSGAGGSGPNPILSMGLPEIVIGAVVLVLIVAITAIAQPPNKWVEWFSGRKKSS